MEKGYLSYPTHKNNHCVACLCVNDVFKSFFEALFFSKKPTDEELLKALADYNKKDKDLGFDLIAWSRLSDSKVHFLLKKQTNE